MKYELLVDGQHLREGAKIFKLRRRFARATRPPLALPDWVSALSLKYRVPPPEAVASGYTGQIAEAERKLSLLLARTARSLSALGITEEDLQALVRERLMARWGLAPQEQAPRTGNEPGGTGGMN